MHKGKLVEQIVADMHDVPGVKVACNVFLPPKGGSGRKREIDVLITGELAGYPVRIAIECKNERKPVGAPKMDGFIGKLDYVGIPPQHGIYVSAIGFTCGALERAKHDGVKTLILKGLAEDRLTASVGEAFQSIVYLLPEVVNMSIINNVPQSADPQEILLFYNEQGEICGTVPDLIWQKWLNGEPKSILGEHELSLDVPPNWHQIVNGKVEPTLSASAKVRVLGLLITLGGSFEQHQLVDASSKRVEKFQVNASFDIRKKVYPVTRIWTEDEFEGIIRRPEALRVNIGRIRLPRISIGYMYWPPSERIVNAAAQLIKGFDKDKKPLLPKPAELLKLERTDLSALWEPIWSGHPSIQKRNNH